MHRRPLNPQDTDNNPASTGTGPAGANCGLAGRGPRRLPTLPDMKRIGVFLSSRDNVPAACRRTAEEVGQWIGSTGRTLVYGGARKGLMEVLARHVKDSGGRVVGAVPQILLDRGMESPCLDVAFYCADLNDRKAVLMRESDVLLALPGGIGTLDEIFTVLAARTIGTTCKRVVLYNADGCWDTLLRLLDELHAQGFSDTSATDTVAVVSSVDELARLLG